MSTINLESDTVDFWASMQRTSFEILTKDIGVFSRTVSKMQRENVILNVGECSERLCLDPLNHIDLPLTYSKEDEWNGRNLSGNFVPESKPTDVDIRVKEKRKREHEDVLEKMRFCMKKINEKIEEEIRTQSKFVQNYIKSVYEQCNKCLELGDLQQNAMNIKEESFSKIRQAIVNYNEGRNKKVKLFCKFLVEIERYRIGIFKELLAAAYKQTSEINHLLPYELKEFFEYEILKVNQITLNNFHYCFELQSHLKSENENDVRTWTHKLAKLKEDWILYLRTLKSTLSSPSSDLVVPKFSKKSFAQEKQCLLVDTTYKDEQDIVTETDISRWVICVEKSIDNYNHDLITLICVLKVLNTSIFYRFLSELDEITVQMTILRNIMHPTATNIKECKIDPKYVTDILHEFELYELQILWYEYFKEIQENLKEAEVFINATVILWECHFKRLADLQYCIRIDTENIINKNSLQAEAAEAKFNLIVDQLRQESDERGLKKTMDKANKILNSLDVMYVQHENRAIEILEKYYDYLKREIPIIQTEVKRFLNTFTIDPYFDPKSQRERASRTNLLKNPDEDRIPNQIFYCKYQTHLMKNWMFGIWDALKNYFETCEKETIEEGEHYLNSKIDNIKEANVIRRAFNKTRFERLKHSIYDRRLEELKKHQNRLELHELGIENRIHTLKQKLELLNEQLKVLVTDYQENLKSKCNFLKKLTNSRDIMIHLKQLTSSKELLVKKAVEITDKFKYDYEMFLKTVKYSNMKFRENMKSFSEGGNFSANEIKNFITKLKKIEKKANKTASSLLKDLKKQEQKHAESLDKVVQTIHEEQTTYVEGFAHNESAEKKIEFLQSRIYEEVENLKSEFLDTKKSIQKLIDPVNENLEDSESLHKQHETLKDIFIKFDAISKNILHPKPVTPIKHLNLCPDQGEGSVSTISIADEMKDYTKFLFDTIPKQEDNYLSKLNTYLYRTFQEIQMKAKSFYSGQGARLKEVEMKSVQPTYDRFMNEVLQKYKCYQIQYEINWIENVNDFVKLGDKLKFTINSLCENGARKCEKNVKSSIRETFESLQKNLNNGTNQLENKYMTIHNKLRTLMGHPRNRYMLDKLSEEMAQVLEEDGDTILQMATADKEKLKEVLINELEKIDREVECFKQLDDYMEQTHNIIGILEDQLKTKILLTNDEIDSFGEIDTKLGLARRFDEMLAKTGLIVPISVPHLSLVSHLSLRDAFYWDKYSDRLKKDLAEIVNKNLKALDESGENESKIHLNFQAMWKSDVNKICNLYSVKYNF